MVSALFILTALASLGAFLAVVSATQHVGGALDMDGGRAYWASRAGVEWGVARALAGNCAAQTHIGPFDSMLVTVSCTTRAGGVDSNNQPIGNATEVGLNAIYEIVSTACRADGGNSGCPANAGRPAYAERRISALVERP